MEIEKDLPDWLRVNRDAYIQEFDYSESFDLTLQECYYELYGDENEKRKRSGIPIQEVNWMRARNAMAWWRKEMAWCVACSWRENEIDIVGAQYEKPVTTKAERVNR